MSNQIEKIRAEIEWQIAEAAKEIVKADTFEAITHYRGEVTAYFTLGAFIDKLLKEHPVPADVEKAAEMTAKCRYPYEGGTKGAICEANIPIYQEGFITGAEWKKEQMEKKITFIQNSWYEQGKIDGKYEGLTDDQKYQQGVFDERERLMKESVEGEIVKDISSKLAVTAKVNLDGFKFGDKVSVIIIKKEK